MNVNTYVHVSGDRGAFDRIDYIGRRRNKKWFADQLTDGGEDWLAEGRNYRVAAESDNPYEPMCVDQDEDVPFETFKDITVTQGQLAPCECRRHPLPPEEPVTTTNNDIVPTLAEPVVAEPLQAGELTSSLVERNHE